MPVICQVTCCGENATTHNPECKIQPPSARCSRHTRFACKEATSCRCGLDQPPASRTRTHATAPSVPTSNRYQPLGDILPDPPTYEVEKIVAARTTKGIKQFYVKWVGYPSHQNTWEEEDALTQARDILNDFLSQVPDPPPPLTRCQYRQCSGEAAMKFPRCRSIPPSTRCTTHISIPCGPATHCLCKPSTKRQRSLSPQPHRSASPTRHQPNTQVPPRPLPLSPISEITYPQPYNVHLFSHTNGMHPSL